MQRIKYVLPVMTMLIACVGCGGGNGGSQSSTPMGSTPAPTTGTTGSSVPPAPPTPPPSSAPAAPGTIDDTDASIIYSRGNDETSNWSHFQPAPEDYQQGEHSSNFVRGGGPVTGPGVVVHFSGTGITWIGKKGPNYGIASYSIDGGAPKTVDTYNSKQVNQNPNLTISGLASESHVLSISLTARKNAASSGFYQTIDAFNVEGSALAATQASIAGYGSSELKLSGKWDGGRVTDGSDLSGGHYWSNQAKASMSWTFVGSLIEVFGRPDYEDGYMDVYIDTNPTPVATVDARWGSSDDDTLNAYLLFAKKLSPGQHTIKLVVAGKHDSGARDNYVQIDELVAFQ